MLQINFSYIYEYDEFMIELPRGIEDDSGKGVQNFVSQSLACFSPDPLISKLLHVQPFLTILLTRVDQL